MSDISIRPATSNDLDILLEFEQKIIETERPFDPTLREGSDVHYYDLAALIDSANAEVLVAEADAKIIASGYARIDDAKPYLKHRKFAHLGFMYVLPEYRGKGVNGRIVDALEAWSRSKGVTEMRLEVYDANAAAIRAYEKCGYGKLLLVMRKALR